MPTLSKKPTKSKRLISIFIHCYPPAKGGAEFLSEQIKQVLDLKYIVHVFTGKGLSLDSYKNFSNFTNIQQRNIHQLSLKKFQQRLCNKLLNKFIFKFSVFSPLFFGPNLKYSTKNIEIIRNSDLLIGIAMPTKSFVDASCFAKKYHKKLILVPCYHDVIYYNACPSFQKAFNQADKVICLTNFEKRQLVKNYYILPSKLSQLTFSPVKKQNQNINPKAKRIKKHISQKQIRLGCVGQITTRKNLIFFKHYLDKYINFWQKKQFCLTILLAGTKTNSSKLVEKQLSTHKNIIKIKYDFPQSQKNHIFNSIDFFINPSVEESLSIVGFEAIQNNNILFVPQNTAFSEFINTNLFNNVDDFHQKLITIITQPSNIPDTLKEQQNILKLYNHDNFKQQLLNLVQSIFK